MKFHLAIAAFASLLLTSLSVQAAPCKVTLAVHHANCALCGPIVKKSLERVSGVQAVVVSEPDFTETIIAQVTFNDASTSIPKLIATTTQAGYPSEIVRPAQKR